MLMECYLVLVAQISVPQIAVPQWNAVALVLLGLLFVWFKVDLLGTLLNLQAFAATRPPDLLGEWDDASYAKARAYHLAHARFDIATDALQLVMLIAFWMMGGFQWLQTTAQSVFPQHVIAQGLVVIALWCGAQMLIDVPFSAYRTFRIEQVFGFNQSSVGLFIGDLVKNLSLSLALGLPLAALVLWLFQHLDHAWLWAWVTFSLFQLLMMWLAPALILPLFNRFEPMPDGQLKQAIAALAQRCDFPLHGLFVMDGSKRSTKANAFFTGWGKNKKIALYDTLIQQHSEPELLAILAHEIGHFRCKHIVQRLGVALVQSLALCYLLGLATHAEGDFARQLFAAFGVASITPAMGLVLFMVMIAPLSRVLGLLSNAWSRRHEFEADAYAAQVTGRPQDLIAALSKLSHDHLAHPTPHVFHTALHASHPPVAARVAALRRLTIGAAHRETPSP